MLMSHEDAVDVAAYIGTLRGGESTESARNSDSAPRANGAARADGR
jgi:hypothetical protein